MVGGAAVGGICAILILVIDRQEDELSVATQVMVFAGMTVVGGLLGGTLSLKDLVERRHRAGRPTPLLLRLLFGMGIVSLLLVWVPFVFLVTVATLFLTLGT
jgi:hypothetical protein